MEKRRLTDDERDILRDYSCSCFQCAPCTYCQTHCPDCDDCGEPGGCSTCGLVPDGEPIDDDAHMDAPSDALRARAVDLGVSEGHRCWRCRELLRGSDSYAAGGKLRVHVTCWRESQMPQWADRRPALRREFRMGDER